MLTSWFLSSGNSYPKGFPVEDRWEFMKWKEFRSCWPESLTLHLWVTGSAHLCHYKTSQPSEKTGHDGVVLHSCERAELWRGSKNKKWWLKMLRVGTLVCFWGQWASWKCRLCVWLSAITVVLQLTITFLTGQALLKRSLWKHDMHVGSVFSPALARHSIPRFCSTNAAAFRLLDDWEQSQQRFPPSSLQTLAPSSRRVCVRRWVPAHQHVGEVLPICAHLSLSRDWLRVDQRRLFSGLLLCLSWTPAPGVSTLNESFGCSSQKMKIGWVSCLIRSRLMGCLVFSAGFILFWGHADSREAAKNQKNNKTESWMNTLHRFFFYFNKVALTIMCVPRAGGRERASGPWSHGSLLITVPLSEAFKFHWRDSLSSAHINLTC